jgi:hypothetical protein
MPTLDADARCRRSMSTLDAAPDADELVADGT